MMKAIATSIVLFMLTAPALADEASSYRVDYGGGTLYVTDHMCAETSAKTRDRESVLKVCAKPLDAKSVRIDVERHFRDKTDEKRTTGAVVAARSTTSGTTFDILDMKLTVKQL